MLSPLGGGGFKNLKAIELSAICNKDQECKISSNQDITNSTPLSIKSIDIQTQLTSFTNTSNLTSTDTNKNTLQISQNGGITTFTNEKSGVISGGILIMSDKSITTINNYGTMGGVQIEKGNTTLNNMGLITTITGTTSTHLSAGSDTKISIQNYKIKIDESANEFNNFKGGDSVSSEASKNSHLMIGIVGGKIEFKDINSKIILAFGEKFSFGEAYFISKLVTGTSGEKDTNLNVDFSRLELGDKDLYTLVKSGDNAFIVNLIGGGDDTNPNKPAITIHTPITAIYKSNIRTMNNFYVMSNAMIYPRKSQNLGRAHSLLQHSPSLAEGARGWVEYPSLQADSAIPLKSYESFAYRNEAVNRRIQRQNKRNYNRKSLKTQNLGSSSLRASEYERGNPNNSLRDSANQTNPSLRADSQNLRGNPKDLRAKRSNHPQNQRFSQNPPQNPHDYYFILTPFVNHNYFFESGRYNLSGFDYGFLTAFSTQVAESNSLGAHFIFSYGSLGDKKDKDLSIKSLNLNLGINYKLDLIYDMFLKARGDFFYFLNQVKTLTMFETIKPNNLGFGASVAYGKDFDFKQGGVLGIEGGLDYKALQSGTISLHDNVYQKALYHLLYGDLGVSYSKYFGNFGVNAGLGIKGNITANKLAKSQIHISNLNRNVDMVLDNDMFLGYANLGASYMLNAKNFDMEFSLAYYGNFGDRVISNGGGFEWRVLF